jgi:hypothetical protein
MPRLIRFYIEVVLWDRKDDWVGEGMIEPNEDNNPWDFEHISTVGGIRRTPEFAWFWDGSIQELAEWLFHADITKYPRNPANLFLGEGEEERAAQSIDEGKSGSFLDSEAKPFPELHLYTYESPQGTVATQMEARFFPINLTGAEFVEILKAQISIRETVDSIARLI